MSPKVCLLSGGVGGAKLALGLYRSMQPEGLSIIANSGDDLDIFGLRVCPDSDILIYTLAGEVDAGKGWGIEGETFRVLERVKALGGPGWFNLGDVDLGLHLYRTQLLADGVGLVEITRRITAHFKLGCRVYPMCEALVPTYLDTSEGRLHLQEYLIQRGAEPVVREISNPGVDNAVVPPEAIHALESSDLIIIAPSNPLISIGPILAVPGLRERLRAATGLKVAVSPIVGGKSLKGPTAKMLQELGHAAAPASVAGMYKDFLDVFVIDEQDASHSGEIADLGLTCHVAQTVMSDDAAKQALARDILGLL